MENEKAIASRSRAINQLELELEQIKRKLSEARRENHILTEQLELLRENLPVDDDVRPAAAAIPDGSPFLLARCGRDLRYRYVSPAYAALVGLPPSDIVGRPVAEVIGDAGFQTIQPYIEEVLKGVPVEYEIRVPVRNAGERILRVIYVPETDAEGSVTGWIASILDLTGEKNVSAALHESEKRFRSVFTGNMTAMGVWRANGTVTEANDALLDMIGFSRADLEAGKIDWLHLTAPEYRHLDRRALDELAEKQICEPYEKAFFSRDGARIPVIFGASCFAEETDRGIFFVVDLTEPKRREANLAFLTDIFEDLANLSSADEIMRTISAKLGYYLKVSSCLFAEIDDQADQAFVMYAWRAHAGEGDMPAVQRISDLITEDFRRMARNKQTIIIRNTETDPRTNFGKFEALGIRSSVTVPFHRDRQWKYLFVVNDEKEREWRRDEIELIDEITNRVFPRLERARAEMALQQSEGQMRVITDAMPGLISYIDHEYRYRFVNKAYSEWFGYPREYFFGKTMAEIFGAEAFAELRPHIDLAFAGKFESFERKTNYKQGTRYIRASYTPDFSAAGTVRGIFVLVLDVTESKLQEEALRQSEERYRGIVDGSINGIVETDLDGRFLTVNSRYCEIVGYSADELLSGMRMQDLTHPDDLAGNQERFAALISDNVTFEIEKRYLRKDGTTVWVHNSVFLLRNADGKPQSVAAVVLDVSERKAAEDELREREQMARLNAEISRTSLLSSARLSEILRISTDLLVRYLNAAFVRIWLADETGRMLELKTSAGIYTHLDGEHSRIPVGSLKIGAIAAERRPYFTNDVLGDPGINDYEWVRAETMTAFAGYPLVADGKLIGVVALFSRLPLTEQKFDALGQAANLISSAIARKRAEDALRESEARFRNMADHAPVMIWMTEVDGSCSYLSKSWYEYTGQSPETGLGFGYIEAIHPDDREPDKNALLRATDNKESFTFEHRLRHRSGEYRWVICSAQPRFGETGEFLGFIGSVLDITERKEVESRLLAKDELLTQITNVTPTLLTRCSRDRRFLFVNRAASEFFGAPSEAIVGQPIRKIIGDAAYREILPYIRRVLKGEYVEYETEMSYGSAGRRVVQVVYMPERDRQGRIVGWFATMTDFTERKKNEEARAFLASIVESSDDAVISKDLNGIITSWNQAAERTFGYSAAEIVGKPVTMLIPPMLGNEEDHIIERLRSGESIEHYETIRRRKDGSLVNVSLTVSPIRDIAGKVVGASKIARDITERKQAELRLRQSEARLKLAMEISALGTWDLDYPKDLMIWSDELFAIFGMEATPDRLMTPAEWEAMIHPDDRERVLESSRAAAASRQLFNTEFRIRRRDTGETRWLSALAQFFYDENDRLSRSVGIIRDITMRKEAQDKLRQSEEFNSIIATISTDWAFSMRVEPNGRLIPDAITSGFAKQLGYRFEKVAVNGKWEVLIHPEDRRHAKNELQKLLRGEMVRGEIRLVTRRGRTVISEYQTRPITGEDGRVVRIYGAIRDITQQKLSEQSLRESEERLRDVISSATEYAIFTMTLEGIIDSWSLGAERIFGYTNREIIGQSFEILFTAANRRKNVPLLEMKNALTQGRVSDDRYHQRKNGSRFFASGVMMTLMKNGVAAGFVKITRDMTNQITAEKAVRDKEILQKLVTAQEDERRRIARDLHDELGQQLTALRLKLETTRRICRDDAVESELSKIQSIAKQIDQGVDFLAWELRPVALDDLGLYAALDKYVTEWSAYSGIRAELLPSSIKAERFSSEVETNLYRIAQEALNNSSKHSRAQKVEIQLEKRNNIIILIISDNGVGFNAKTKNLSGKGIGLIGMRERALLIGGQVEIESTPGDGSTIYVRVPVSFNKKEKTDER